MQPKPEGFIHVTVREPSALFLLSELGVAFFGDISRPCSSCRNTSRIRESASRRFGVFNLVVCLFSPNAKQNSTCTIFLDPRDPRCGSPLHAMSKRQAEFQIHNQPMTAAESRAANMMNNQAPQKATPAQLAARK